MCIVRYMKVAYIYSWIILAEVEHPGLKTYHIFPLAAITLFWWIVFVPQANRFFYINTLNVRWLHALNCSMGFNWMVNGFFFLFCHESCGSKQVSWTTDDYDSTKCYFLVIRWISRHFPWKYSFYCWNQVLAKRIALAMATHRHKNPQY